jgi:8-oxo-dGTP pyrophosphatase MutT (NUDIX family)/phosphohistidine phosphatase SixA
MSQSAPVVAPPVLAAGAVVWRMVDGKARVLAVHRTVHKDVSLPKGKVDPGESLPQTAVREILEETGLAVSLGAPLGTAEYTMMTNGRDKVVHYWSAEVHDHQLEIAKFVPNAEISGLEWLPIKTAGEKLSYPHDREIVERLRARIKAGNARTFGLIVLRHAKAVPPDAWDGPDSTRPLLHRGSDQAVAIADGIAAFAPERIISSTAARCLATVAPLAEATGIEIKQEPAISQDAYEHGQADVERIVEKALRRRQTAVLCSHGPVIPDLIDEVAASVGASDDPDIRRSASLGTADYTVLHISRKHAQLVAVETHSPPV